MGDTKSTWCVASVLDSAWRSLVDCRAFWLNDTISKPLQEVSLKSKSDRAKVIFGLVGAGLAVVGVQALSLMGVADLAVD